MVIGSFRPMPDTNLSWKKAFEFLRFATQRLNEDRCPQVAASLTFTTLLALVPLVTVAVTVLSAFPVFTELITQLKLFLLSNMVPDKAGKVITVYMQQFANKATRLTILGIASLVVTALMLIHTIDVSFNAIWRVQRRHAFVPRFLTYWAALTVGPILLGASLSITYYLLHLSLGYTKTVPLFETVVLKLTPLLLMSAAFALLYYTVPNRQIRFKHAAIGGLVAGILFELMKHVFTWYITAFPTYTLVYGAFAAFPVFLLWIYFSWLTVLLGAELTVIVSRLRGATWQRTARTGWRFDATLHLMVLLANAQHTGHGTTLHWLQQQVGLGVDDVEDLLERLRQAHYVRRAEKGNWLLSRAPSDITVGDLYRMFVFEPRPNADGTPQQIIEQLNTAQQAVLGKTLAQLAEQK